MTSTREVIFYILSGLFFAIFFVSTNYFYSGKGSSSRGPTMKAIILIVASIIFTFVIVGYISFTGLFKKENYSGTYATCSGKAGCGCGGSFGSPSPGAKLCRGGAYMHQGSSPRSKFCRNLASTPEGRAEIQRYECGSGFTGMPGCGFKFTTISNDCWRNERCDSKPSCNVENNGIF